MARQAVSAIWPLDVALATAIETEHARDGAPLAELLDTPPVWSGTVPVNETLAVGRVVLGASTENDAPGTFSRLGAATTVSVDIWTADTSKRTGALIAGELRRLLHRVPLMLEGYGEVRGSFEIVVSMLDPSREQYHYVARYSTYSLNPSAD